VRIDDGHASVTSAAIVGAGTFGALIIGAGSANSVESGRGVACFAAARTLSVGDAA
jgi:hypothetical protein